MENSTLRDEFLSLKYNGVKTPWEIMASAIAVGWKCRKYIKWDLVQESRNDKKVLKDFGDALIDEHCLDTVHLGAINKIFEKVQRWRLDPKSLSVEPDLRPGYDRLRRSLATAASSPGVVSAVLMQSGWLPTKCPPSVQRDLFLSHEVIDFLRSFEGAPFPIVTSPPSPDHILADLEATLKKLYSDFGLSPKHKRGESLVDVLFSDLGLSFDADLSKLDALSDHPQSELPQVVVELIDSRPETFVSCRFVRGQVVVQINKSHPCFPMLSLEPLGRNAINPALYAFGEAVLDMLGSLDTLNDFFACFGLSLYRRAIESTDRQVDEQPAASAGKPRQLKRRTTRK